MIWVDKKELGADPNAIQQIRIDGQLKNRANSVVSWESMFVLTILVFWRKHNFITIYGKL